MGALMKLGGPKQIAYWVATVVSVVGVGGTGLLDLMGATEMAQHVTALGYPAYLQHFLGVAKLLGSVVILLPRLPRLKEWGYAGMTFDLAGATYSHIAHRDAVAELMLPVSLLMLLALSYLLRPDSRRLPDAFMVS